MPAQSQQQSGGRPASNPSIAPQQPTMSQMQNMYNGPGVQPQMQQPTAPNQYPQQTLIAPASRMASGMHMQTQHPKSGYQKPAPPPPSRKKHVIAIVDPDTKATINEDQLAPQTEDKSDNMSTPTSSNRSKPAPPHSTTEHSQPNQVAAAQPTSQPTREKSNADLGAEFKAQVFASLSNFSVSVTSESTPPMLPSNLPNGSISSTITATQSTPTTSHSKKTSSVQSQHNPRSHDGTNLRGSAVIFYTLPEVQLQRAENPWKPGVVAGAHIVLVRKFRGILNKITPTMFKTLLEKILQLPVLDEKHLSAVMILIYEKALNEPLYSKIYATICQAIAKEYKVNSEVTGEEVNFHKLLLICCQKEFEMLAQDGRQMLEKMQNLKKALENAQTDKEKALLKEECETIQTKARHRKLGYMRFLGELFLLQMLTVKIMHECMTCLLKAADEQSLEYLCQLWTTIGKVLDTNEKARTYNDQYFAQMKKFATGVIGNVSVRIRFALQDVIELRQNEWIPRRDKNVPKTLKEIHKLMAMEAAEKQVMIDKGIPTRNSQGRAPQAPRSNRRDDLDGWSHVKTGTQRVEPTKLKLTSQKVGGDKELQLGTAKGFGGWSRGRSGSGKSTPPQQEERQSAAPANRFSALTFARGRYYSSSTAEMAGQLSKGSKRPSWENRVDGHNLRTPTPTRGQANRLSFQSAAPAVKQMSRNEWETKVKSVIDEYLHNKDIQEVLDIARDELASQANKELLTELSLNHTLERSEQARKGTGNMLAELLKHKLLPLDAHLKGLGTVLEFADDLAIDIPNVWQYFGELIAPMFSTAAVPLVQLETVCSPLVAIGKASVLAAAVLKETSHYMGHVELGKRWADSKLTWSKFLSADEDEQAFIQANSLEYTLASQMVAPSTADLSTSDISTQLNKLLIVVKAPNETIFDWIDSKLPSEVCQESTFIRSLTTSVVQSCVDDLSLNEEKFKCRVPLLLKYYDSKPERELAALSAFEDLMTKLEHPADLFSDFCYALSDCDLIADESFFHWEQTSKTGIAVKSVGKFIKWLRDAE